VRDGRLTHGDFLGRSGLSDLRIHAREVASPGLVVIYGGLRQWRAPGARNLQNKVRDFSRLFEGRPSILRGRTLTQKVPP
jgi:hypothetical protein